MPTLAPIVEGSQASSVREWICKHMEMTVGVAVVLVVLMSLPVIIYFVPELLLAIIGGAVLLGLICVATVIAAFSCAGTCCKQRN